MFNRSACEINNDNNVNIDDTEQENWEAEVKNEPSTGFTLGKGFYESQEDNDYDNGGSVLGISNDFHQLSISKDHIILVDSVEKLKEMIQRLFQVNNLLKVVSI